MSTPDKVPFALFVQTLDLLDETETDLKTAEHELTEARETIKHLQDQLAAYAQDLCSMDQQLSDAKAALELWQEERRYGW